VRAIIASAAIALSMLLTFEAAAQENASPRRKAIVAAAAPIYLLPDANRTPLRVAPEGSWLNVLDTAGEWYHVEFNDPQIGPRVGYVQAKFVTLSQPEDRQPSAAASSNDSIEPARSPATAATPLRAIHRLFVEKMPNDLDQSIGAEISKQMNGRLLVVLDKADAEAVLRGVGSERTGTGSVSLVDKDQKLVLWSVETGDRRLWFGTAKRSDARKIADRLVRDLKKAIEQAR